MLLAILTASSQADPPHMVGSWKIEITFPNGESRSVRFDAQDGGKGSFQLLDPRSQAWGSAKPADAKWTQGSDKSVTFSGPIEFPLGNVGRDPGTLVFDGKRQLDGTITGEVEFSRLSREQPSKHGTFKASRVGGH